MRSDTLGYFLNAIESSRLAHENQASHLRCTSFDLNLVYFFRLSNYSTAFLGPKREHYITTVQCIAISIPAYYVCGW